MKLSIVAAIYQAEGYIEEFIQRAYKAADLMEAEDFEIVLVNDGSTDKSLNIALEMANKIKELRIVDLSRNFGQHKAIMTGLRVSRGDYVFLLDSDLEEKPEWLRFFYDILLTEDCDVVYGFQKRRKGGLFERVSGALFYKITNKVTDLRIPRGIVTARLMTKRYVNALTSFRETEVFIAGLWQLTGFKQIGQEVTKESKGYSAYTALKKLYLSMTMITSFSAFPLYACFYIGLGIFTMAIFGTAWILFRQIALRIYVEGWVSVIASVWLVGGSIIMIQGIVGIYLARVFAEVKKRPYTIIRRMYN